MVSRSAAALVVSAFSQLTGLLSYARRVFIKPGQSVLWWRREGEKGGGEMLSVVMTRA